MTDLPPRRRHRAVCLALTAAIVAVPALGACSPGGTARDSIETPTTAVGPGADEPTTVAVPASGGVGASRPGATGGTDPVSSTTDDGPHELLAPPPTVRPALERDGDMAPLVRRVDTTDRVIFITIDDGQVRDPAALDHLLELGLPFTSFLTEPLAEADPSFWKGTQAAWGMIETHTINHVNLREAGEATQRREICEPAATFEGLFGRRPTLFRPPYGNSSDSVRRIAAGCGYDAVVLWTGSTNNETLTMQEIALRPGDIVLVHYRDTLRADIDAILERARAEGFTIGRLEDYLSPGR